MVRSFISFLFLVMPFLAKADTWRKQPGQARDIGIGADGSVWVIGNIPVAGGYSIHRWNGREWEQVEGGGVRVAVDPSGQPWIINDRSEIHRRDNGRWMVMPEKAIDIGIGVGGQVWIISTNPTIGGHTIKFWNSTTWSSVTGGGKRITVGPNGQPFIVNETGEIFERVKDGSWKKYPGNAQDISLGSNGSMWVIGNKPKGGSYSIHQWQANYWDEAEGSGTQIAVGPSGKPWVTDHLFQIFRLEYTAPVYKTIWSVSPLTHDYPYSGKIESLSVDPLNQNHVMVAGCGGVFESFNATANTRKWTFNMGLNTPFVSDVLLTGIPSYAQAWAATTEEYTSSRLPQIWQKNRSGSWIRAEFAPGTSVPAGKTSCYRVVQGPETGTFYACGEFGVAYFGISGYWRLMDNNIGQPVYSMAILKNGLMAAGTKDGIFVFDQASRTWVLRNSVMRLSDFGTRYQMNTDAGRRVILVTDLAPGHNVQFTADGSNWGSLSAPPAYDGAAGGFISIYMDSLVSGNYSLFVSNKYKFYRAEAPGDNPLQALRALGRATNSIWSEPIQPGHDDTRHFARLTTPDGAQKIMMTSDGGMHVSSFSFSGNQGYNWVTDRPTTGLNNLEVYNLTGTPAITNFGTQHNGFGALSNSNRLLGSGLNEGYVLSRRGLGDIDPRTVIFAPDSRLPTGLSVQGTVFGEEPYRICSTPDPFWLGPNNGWGNPIWLGNRIYIQDAAPPEGRSGVFPWKISYDNGCTWDSLPDGNSMRKGMAAGLSLKQGVEPVLVVAVEGPRGVRLDRLLNPLNTRKVRWQSPAPTMNGLNGGVAYFGADFLFNPIFCVNPVNHDHILALESDSYKVKKSTDGGNNWEDLTSLNREITEVARFDLKGTTGKSQIRTMSFSPYDPNCILVGTATAGVFISVNGGVSWKRVQSPGLVQVSDFHWKSSTHVMISTYGHGLFSLVM